MKFPQEYDDGGIIILDDLNENEMNDLRVKAMFKRSRHNILAIFTLSQDSYELPKRIVRANGNIYHIFKPNSFLDGRNIYQDKASMDMTLDEFKNVTSTCWNKNYQPITIDMTKDKYTGRYRLRLSSISIPDSSPFELLNEYLFKCNRTKCQ